MTFLKIVELVELYPTPLVVFRYLASFSRSQGADIRPPPVGAKLARTPVGARVKLSLGLAQQPRGAPFKSPAEVDFEPSAGPK